MIIKCKLCGGSLHFNDGSFSAKCDHCGISQFIFDYLEKESEEYDEQVEIIKKQKEDFEKTYLEYADDIINAESYCHTSKDLKKIIDFFEKCVDYKDAPILLPLAKKLFITKVSSSSDCFLALQYVDESDDIPPSEKEALKNEIANSAISQTVVELDQEGYVAILPENHSTENILLVMKKMVIAKGKDVSDLTNFEAQIVNKCLKEAEEYLEENLCFAIKNCLDSDVLLEIKDLISLVKENYPNLQISDSENVLNQKLQELEECERLEAERLRIEKEQQHKKEKAKKHRTIAFILVIILTIAGMVSFKHFGYSANNFEIKVISKTNDDFNENLADGNWGAGYFYLFEFEISNNSPYDVELIRGNLEILNKEGKTLSSSTLEMHCEINKRSTIKHIVQLNVYKGDCARELWDTNLEDLQIKFRTKAIHFKDGTNKTYNSKNKIIYPY